MNKITFERINILRQLAIQELLHDLKQKNHDIKKFWTWIKKMCLNA